MERVGLDQDAFQIHGGEQLPQNRALMVLEGVECGLGNSRTESLGVRGHLGNVDTVGRRPAIGPATAIGRDDLAPRGLAVPHQLIQTRCTIFTLGEHPDLQLSADLGHIHLQEQIAEGGISGRPLELKPQRLVQCSVMTEGKALKIPQALAAAQDPEHRHQEQKPLGKAHPASHPPLGDRLQETDQVGRGIDRRGFWQRGDPFPPTKPNRRSPGELTRDGLSISPASEDKELRQLIAGAGEGCHVMASTPRTQQFYRL